MELSLTVLTQVLVMFVLMGVGMIGFKTKIITDAGKLQLTDLLLYIISPFVMLNAFQMEFDEKLVVNLMYAFGLAIVSHIIGIVVAQITIRKKNNPNYAVERFGIIYSNAGFMAIPLISAIFGAEGVFYSSAYLTVFNLLAWTHGYIMMSGNADKKTIRKSLLSPTIIAIGVGLVIFFFKINLPTMLTKSITYIADLNTPIAMLVSGVTLAQTNFLSAFKSLRSYYIMFISCIVVPFCAMALYLFLPISSTVVLVNLVATGASCAVMTVLFATKFKLDAAYASKILTLCNLLTVITLPLLVLSYQYLSTLVS